jgi:hypothetical protein
MIDEKRLTQALTYLANTDEECASLRAEMEQAEFKAKAVKDTVFRHLEGSVADRTAAAGSSEVYKEAMNDYFSLLRRYDAMKNKRSTQIVVIDTWRSLNASRRQGNV